MRIVLIIIVLILLLYFVSFFHKLKHVDRSAIVHSIKDIKTSDTLPLLLFPFKETNYIARYTNGRIYLKYMKKYPELKKKMDNKMFWIYSLQKYNIPHETLVANCEESHCIEHQTIDKNADYIEHSASGSKTMKGNDIIMKEGVVKAWTKNDCSLHSEFKIVTLYNQELFCVWDTKSKKPMTKLLYNKNRAESQCFSNCDIKEDIGNKRILFELATKLVQMHFREFPSVFSISWHVQICDFDGLVTKANADPFTKEMSQNDELLNKYQQKFHEFLVLDR